jgi:GAF domain-containing protein
VEGKLSLYEPLIDELRALLEVERDMIANAANTSALLHHRLPEVNWVGFYFLRGSELVVGPFQGKPACVRIPIGRGVCGTAVAERRVIVVPDVHAFPGHIACDVASRSEVVAPFVKRGKLIGVLDIDSPQLNRFDEEDGRWVSQLADVFVQASDT